MTTAADFLPRILDDPTDDTPRLVFADWLEESGTDTLRAEFIRSQCALAKLPPPPRAHRPLLRLQSVKKGPDELDISTFSDTFQGFIADVLIEGLLQGSVPLEARRGAVVDVYNVGMKEYILGCKLMWSRADAATMGRENTWVQVRPSVGAVLTSDDPTPPDPHAEERARLTGREKELERVPLRLWKAWCAPMTDLGPNVSWEMHRGFVDSLALPAADWFRHADVITAAQPVTRVELTTRLMLCVTPGEDGMDRDVVRLTAFPDGPSLRLDEIRGFVGENNLAETLLEKKWDRIKFTITAPEAAYISFDISNPAHDGLWLDRVRGKLRQMTADEATLRMAAARLQRRARSARSRRQ